LFEYSQIPFTSETEPRSLESGREVATAKRKIDGVASSLDVTSKKLGYNLGEAPINLKERSWLR